MRPDRLETKLGSDKSERLTLAVMSQRADFRNRLFKHVF